MKNSQNNKYKNSKSQISFCCTNVAAFNVPFSLKKQLQRACRKHYKEWKKFCIEISFLHPNYDAMKKETKKNSFHEKNAFKLL